MSKNFLSIKGLQTFSDLINESRNNLKATLETNISDTATRITDQLVNNINTVKSEITAALNSHTSNKSNPHAVTISQIGAAASTHNHDSVYSKLTHNHDSVYSKLGHTHSASDVGASASGHTHDDRYYTESEVNNLLNGKSNTSHTHNVIQDSGDGRNITFNYSGSGLTTAQWLAAWNGNELRAISPSVLKNLLGVNDSCEYDDNEFERLCSAVYDIVEFVNSELCPLHFTGTPATPGASTPRSQTSTASGELGGAISGSHSNTSITISNTSAVAISSVTFNFSCANTHSYNTYTITGAGSAEVAGYGNQSVTINGSFSRGSTFDIDVYFEADSEVVLNPKFTVTSGIQMNYVTYAVGTPAQPGKHIETDIPRY